VTRHIPDEQGRPLCGAPAGESAEFIATEEQGDMRPMWTFEGDELRRLVDDLAEEPSWSPIYRVRFAVDEGELKWKINEDMWSPGKAPDEARS
jgi:hypothetical protein